MTSNDEPGVRWDAADYAQHPAAQVTDAYLVEHPPETACAKLGKTATAAKTAPATASAARRLGTAVAMECRKLPKATALSVTATTDVARRPQRDAALPNGLR